MSSISIVTAIRNYLDNVKLARSGNTYSTYLYALNSFMETLRTHKIKPEETSIIDIPRDSLSWFMTDLKSLAPASERLYLRALIGFYKYLSAEQLVDINLPKSEILIRQRSRRIGQRLPQFPKDAIDQVLEYAEKLTTLAVEDDSDRLRNLRDRSFLLTLADTGLRVHEACKLRRGDMDWNEGRALVIGKGDREDVIRFSTRSMKALRDYLNARSKLDGTAGKALAALPLFARHDPGAGKRVQAITTTSGRNIVNQRVKEALGPDIVGQITPHSFRHYFVTRVLQASGNLKLAQELARHKNIAVTQRYAHLSDNELDKGYFNAIEGTESD